MQFRDDEQLASVCQALCDLVGISSSPLWLPQGPTSWARGILMSYRYGGSKLTLSWSDQIVFLIACAFWYMFCSNEKNRLFLQEPSLSMNSRLRSGAVEFDTVIKMLNSKSLSALGELLVTYTEGLDAIDRWIQKFDTKKQPWTCPKCGKKILCQYELKSESPVSSILETVEYFTHKCGNCGFSETYNHCLASQSENELDTFDPVHIEPSKSCPLCEPTI